MATFQRWEQAKKHQERNLKLTENGEYKLVTRALNGAAVTNTLRDTGAQHFNPESWVELVKLAEGSNIQLPAKIPDDQKLFNAWRKVVLSGDTVKHLERLQLNSGDIVTFVSSETGKNESREVSSLGTRGQVFLRGNSQVRLARINDVMKPGDAGYEEACSDARNLVAKNSYGTGSGRTVILDELAEFAVNTASRGITDLALYAYEDALETATDEEPMQKVLARFPELFALFVQANHGLYVIPEPRLSGNFTVVPDFLVVSVTSAGPTWLFVELETPGTKLQISDGQFTEKIRHGQQQIKDWREWLRYNLAHAQRSRAEGGLGFRGIRDDSPGLVLAGRSAPSTTVNRDRVRNLATEDIKVRSYTSILRASTYAPLLGIEISNNRNVVFDATL